MRDYSETDATAAGNSGGVLEADANEHDGKTLRDEAEYASLTRRAATDNSRGLVDDVLRQIAQTETRERRRGAKANASFRQAIEGFLGDLLAAKGRKGDAGWIFRSVAPSCFTGDVVSARKRCRGDTAMRQAIRKIVMDAESGELRIYWHHVADDAAPHVVVFPTFKREPGYSVNQRASNKPTTDT